MLLLLIQLEFNLAPQNDLLLRNHPIKLNITAKGGESNTDSTKKRIPKSGLTMDNLICKNQI